jgi:hypothetical protein
MQRPQSYSGKAGSLILASLLAVLSAVPAAAHPRYHRVVVRNHHEYVRVVLRGSPYYYHYGHFYARRPHGYWLVPPPLGVRVAFLPATAIRLRFGPASYWYYEGIYYRGVPEGYEVVSKPDTVYIERQPGGETETEVFQEPKGTTILVLNGNGSKTPVRLEELEGGKWKGPKGEIYDSLPTQEQLRSAYGF